MDHIVTSKARRWKFPGTVSLFLPTRTQEQGISVLSVLRRKACLVYLNSFAYSFVFGNLKRARPYCVSRNVTRPAGDLGLPRLSCLPWSEQWDCPLGPIYELCGTCYYFSHALQRTQQIQVSTRCLALAPLGKDYPSTVYSV